jgi:SPP1 family predicted phage head-tail adaptor
MPGLPRINAGDLNRYITISQPTQTADDMGDVQPSWSEVKKVWAKRTILSGNEAAEATAIYGDVNVRYEMRMDTALVVVDAGCRIEDAGQTVEIIAVLDGELSGEPLVIMGRLRR